MDSIPASRSSSLGSGVQDLQLYLSTAQRTRDAVAMLRVELSSLASELERADAGNSDETLASLEQHVSALGTEYEQMKTRLVKIDRDAETQRATDAAQSQRSSIERESLQREMERVKEQHRRDMESLQRKRKEEAAKSTRDMSLLCMLSGTLVTKCNRNAKSHSVFLRLSSDRAFVTWRELGQSKAERSLAISSVTRVTPGRTTDVFRLQPTPEDLTETTRSLSLIAAGRTLDIVFETAELCGLWLAGLLVLVSAA